MKSKQYVAAFVRPAANSTKLEETKAQRQKSLKEMLINKEKETRRELERLKKYTDPEPLSTAKTANRVRDNTTRKRTKLLQVDYEELQMAHIIEEKFTNELQAEKNKNKLLTEELEQLCFSYRVLKAMYEHYVPKIREQLMPFSVILITRSCRRITCSFLMKPPLHSRWRERRTKTKGTR
ncbi:hypothetical protein GBF38_017529 [Nibea albiflora]|uniref:Uncharacterized protein n=1 Tax=Nibea albiflora TaxID=240163 RepID=A0ACB7FJM6_NIBAL|nr:hypothetical protein GBF38_017529 [Nibea albiflora]